MASERWAATERSHRGLHLSSAEGLPRHRGGRRSQSDHGAMAFGVGPGGFPGAGNERPVFLVWG